MGWKGKGRKRKRSQGDGRRHGEEKQGGTGGKGKGAGKVKRLTGELPERAFVVSSETPAMCQKATKEAIALLMAVVETSPSADRLEVKAEGSEAQQPRNGTHKSVSEALESELRELRGEDEEGGVQAAKKRRISFLGEVTRGVAILSCPRKADAPDFPAPSQLVESVFQEHRKGTGLVHDVRFVVRLLPLDFVCSPHLSNFRTAAAASLPTAFASVPPGATWYLAWFGRAMSTIKREDALVVIKEVLKPLGLELSVSDAEHMIIVEVNPALCGFSVLRDFDGPPRKTIDAGRGWRER